MDLSKAFDTVPHDLITSKLKMYGTDDKTVELIKDYLLIGDKEQGSTVISLHGKI